MDKLRDILQSVESAPPDVQRAVLLRLRELHPIHPLEASWQVPAEVILEAISRSSDLSQRGVRGLIAEAYFEQRVLPMHAEWANVTPPGAHAYDFLLQRGPNSVRIQVKSQRRKAGRPMTAKEGYRHLSSNKLVVETQKTRAGTDDKGKSTRPYRFGEFDVLAVSMEASTGNWTQFRYTVERWLLPHPSDPSLILKFQPVSLHADDDWTDDLNVALDWFMSDQQKQIGI
jgi:hypothetical protein